MEEFIQCESMKIDLFYSSHSLEHVADIDEFMKMLMKISHKDTYYFLKFQTQTHRQMVEQQKDRHTSHILL